MVSCKYAKHFMTLLGKCGYRFIVKSDVSIYLIGSLFHHGRVAKANRTNSISSCCKVTYLSSPLSLTSLAMPPIACLALRGTVSEFMTRSNFFETPRASGRV